jgi:transposase
LAEVMMRGTDRRSGELFSYVDLERRVRADHPLRTIRATANAALDAVSADFSALYSAVGRPSIPPEMLLRALLLQAFYSIRSERQLMERLEHDLLFRWFVGLGVDDQVWDHSTFSTNRDRLLDGDIAAKFLAAVLAQPRVKRLLSSEHFSVDGTLIEAWASMKSFKPKDEPGGDDDHGDGGRNAPADFKGQKRSNATHASTTDPDALFVPQGTGHGGQALLHRPRPDGEPLRADRRRPVDPCLGPRRTAGRARHDRAAWRQIARAHPRCRQGR